MKSFFPTFVPMNKHLLFLIALISYFSFSKAQYHFYYNDNIIVTRNGDTLMLPWAGGLNNPQFSAIDLNGDGIKDMFVFDRDANKVITFLNQGIANKSSYRFAPQFQHCFPQNMVDWALCMDYNCDGKEDIYTYNLGSGGGGVTIYRNDYNINNGLQFTLVAQTLMTLWNSTLENLYVSPVNLPAFIDMDNDGDIDILSFDPLGSTIYYNRNLSEETYGVCDSLTFKVETSCWGNVATVGNANCFVLNSTCPTPPPGDKRMKHTGGTLLSLDLTGDGLKEMIVGDVISNTSDALYNNGTLEGANINIQDCTYPVTDTPINISTFPACFYVDVNNDGKRDLICAPNAAGISENTHAVWYYKNAGTDSHPDFKYQTDSFFQGNMIEVGQGSMPVFFDYNNDGLQDLVIGNYGYYSSSLGYISGLSLYKNVGTSSQPAFDLITQDFANIDSLHYKNVKATFGDLNGDGKPDMIVGIDSGFLILFLDTASTGFPASYGAPQTHFQNISAGHYATPQLIDVNRDGLIDLLIGNQSGTISYYQNTGTTTLPAFTLMTSNFGGVNVRQPGYLTGYSQPFLFDSSGSYKLMVGSERGYIYYYNNIDGNLAGNFNLVDSMFNYTNLYGNEGTRTSVGAADIDGDGKIDLIIGNQLGGVTLYVSTNPVSTNFPKDLVSSISLFPNPSDNTVTIKVEARDIDMKSLNVCNIIGQEVLNKSNIHSTVTSLNISSLSNGVYFCKIILNTNQEIVKKIIVQH